jgi:hypothetical protein
MANQNFIYVWCGLDVACLNDFKLVNYLKEKGFRQNFKKPGYFYKKVSTKNLMQLKDEATVFYYQAGKRYQIDCPHFSTKINRISVKDEFQRISQERNEFCGYC